MELVSERNQEFVGIINSYYAFGEKMVIIILMLAILFFVSAYFARKKTSLKSIIFDLLMCFGCITTTALVNWKEECLLFGSLIIFWILMFYLCVLVFPKLSYWIDLIMSRITKTPMSTLEDETPEKTIAIKLFYYSVKIVLSILFIMSVV